MDLSSSILSDVIVYLKYARFLEEDHRRETWEEIVARNKAMHVKKFSKTTPDILPLIEEAYPLVLEKKVLPSMRSLQFAGKAAELNPSRIYNCSFLPMDHPLAFSELMFLLLCGCGVGYSVQKHHVKKLPPLLKPKKRKRVLVADSVEGWAEAVRILLEAYFYGKNIPEFDFSDIRPKGTPLKTSGGIAPGPEPLKDCLHNIKKVLDRKNFGDQLTPLEVHDINCYIADAVRAGGIRRSAMIALFSFDDEEMLTSKFGKWYESNPQRGRANNSAVIVRHKVSEEDFMALWAKIKLSGSGEPGFFMTNDKEWGLNPCAEISLRPFQFCNLVTVNVSDVKNQEDLNARVRAAAILATLQASYTHFHFLREEWQETTEKEALIGVSMTGIASGKVLELNLKEAALIVKQTNAEVAKIIGINSAARSTTIKPEGTSSLVLGTSSGVHAWHSKYYIRRVTLDKSEAIYSYLSRVVPELLENSVLKPQTEAFIAVPIKAPWGAMTRKESAFDLLARVSKLYQDWIVPGHRKGNNKNNVSTTVSIKPEEWEAVGKWMWENRNSYTALSVLPYDDHSYPQTPFEDIDKQQYEHLLEHLKEIDLTQVIETKDETKLREEAACAGGVCEIV